MPLFGKQTRNPYSPKGVAGATGNNAMINRDPVINQQGAYYKSTAPVGRNNGTDLYNTSAEVNDPAYGTGFANQQASMPTYGHDNTATGTGIGTGAATAHLGPGTTASHPTVTGTRTKQAMGKLQYTAGTVLCSPTMRAKGLQKETEAKALRAQSVHLDRAVAFEGHAARERQMAVSAGAHQDHGRLGGTGSGPGIGMGVPARGDF